MATIDAPRIMVSGLRLSAADIAEIDAQAVAAHRSRVGQVAYLVEVGLEMVAREKSRRDRLEIIRARVAKR